MIRLDFLRLVIALLDSFEGMGPRARPATFSDSGSWWLALVALFFGGLFFLYALKYYLGMAIILIANGNANGNGNGNGSNGNGFNGLRRGNGANGKMHYHPLVSIHLPLYNEPAVVDRLLRAATSLSYDNYEVIIADDSTDETTTILRNRWANHPRVKVSHRRDRRGFKGGALQKALEITDPRSEFIAVFDADFIPPPDIIDQFLSYFYNGNGHNGGSPNSPPRLVDDRVAAVQGYQWHILNASQNWITKGIRTEYAGSYVIERSVQEILGSMKMIAGSVFMIRTDVLRQHGWGVSITEDWDLTLRLYLSGYKVLYTPFVQAPSECVASFQQLAKQRMRWAEGHTYNVKKYFLRLLASPNLSLVEKFEFCYYAPYYLQSVFFILGTGSWLVAEILLRARLPLMPALLGWALVFTNALSLVLMNLTGLFMERGVRKNWSGLLSFALLTFLLVPYQAFAALKGLIEPSEGGWNRTQKTGVITDLVDRLGLGKSLKKLLPRHRRKRPPVDLGKRLGQPSARLQGLLPAPVLRHTRRMSLGFRLAVLLAVVLVVLALLARGVSIVTAAPDAFYLHPNPLNDGQDMSIAPGSGSASMVFATPGQFGHWYSELAYPTGGENSTLAGGPYQMHLYFDQLPTEWWDIDYLYRQQITVTAGAAITGFYSASLVFDHQALVNANKSMPTGDDVRIAYWNGTTWQELDRVLDPLSGWDRTDTTLWFPLVNAISAGGTDSNYYLYYRNPGAAAPPADPDAVFLIGDDFEDGTLSANLIPAIGGSGSVQESGGEAIVDAGTNDPHAAILRAADPLSPAPSFVIRHRTKLVSGGTNSGTDPQVRLLGVVEDALGPDVGTAAAVDPRRRIMITHVADTLAMQIYFVDFNNNIISWDDISWGGGPIVPWDTRPLNTYHIVEMVSDGTSWWVRVLSGDGSTLLTQTDPITWAEVRDEPAQDYWWYWGEIYTDQYWAQMRSDWFIMRSYVSPEPTTALGAEFRLPTVNITVEVHHTRPDGSDVQPALPIVAASRTITARTSNPLILDLGSGAEQIFTSADPRRLRLRISVNTVQNGGSFTLSYDEGTASSYLNTPSLVVPEAAAALWLLGPGIPLLAHAVRRSRRSPAARKAAER